MSFRRYIQVILPLRLEWEPCYYLPDGVDVQPGERVQVLFAGRRQIAVVSAVDIHPDLPENKIHPVLATGIGLERITGEEMALWRFIADYYLCTVGEVYKAAYPSIKTGSEEIKARVTKQKAALEEKTIELWKTRIERLRRQLANKDADLARKHKDSIMEALSAQRSKIAGSLEEAESRLASLCGNTGDAVKDFSGLLAGISEAAPERYLTAALARRKPLLLISSRRYGTYISLAAETLKKGRNVLILVNESALAGTLQSELEGSFGELLIVHLSAMAPARKRTVSEEIRSGRPYVLIGTRSSIFLPHNGLGLVIVDNEQSPFYKQSDTAPRYNARDCAVMLAQIHGAAVVLGASSPSLESLLNAQNGRYSLVDRSSNGQELHPEGRFGIIDTQAERRKNGMIGPFSRKLLEEAARVVRSDPEARIALIRGFEKEEDIRAAAELIAAPGKADILTIPQAARTDLGSYALTAMLSAEALFDPADFRSDEHAFQYLDSLRAQCANVVVQTSQAKHQIFRIGNTSPLLDERSQFHLPPFTRLVDIRIPFPGKNNAMVEKLYRGLQHSGIDAAYPLQYEGQSSIRVTLPRTRELQQRKKTIRTLVEEVRNEFKWTSGIIIDVDPA